MTIDRPYNKTDPVHRQLLYQSVRALPDGWYHVTVTPMARPSPRQRGYHHGVVVPIAAAMLTETQGQEFGDDDAHEWCKLTFRPRQVAHPLTGEVMILGRSTRGMTPAQFFTYTDQIIEVCQVAGWDVPPPDQRYRELREQASRTERELSTDQAVAPVLKLSPAPR